MKLLNIQTFNFIFLRHVQREKREIAAVLHNFVKAFFHVIPSDDVATSIKIFHRFLDLIVRQLPPFSYISK